MSWKRSGKLLSGPPTLSGRHTDGDVNEAGPSGPRIVDRLRPNTGGLNAFQRERQIVGRYGFENGNGVGVGIEKGKSEWEVLKENHRFIREDEDAGEVSWEERLARAYESKLFKEFALIDLKHYKSKRLALRWRTAPEVVSGIGEETCGSLRCKRHTPPTSVEMANRNWSSDNDEYDNPRNLNARDDERGKQKRKKRRKEKKEMPSLRAFELPFVYQEAGVRREALVKVRLCSRCEGKLRWKAPEERDRGEGEDNGGSDEEEDEGYERKVEDGRGVRNNPHTEENKMAHKSEKRERRDERERSRSRSPRRKDRQ